MINMEFRLQTGDHNFGKVYLPSKDAANLPVLINCAGWGVDHILRGAAKQFCDKMVPAGRRHHVCYVMPAA